MVERCIFVVCLDKKVDKKSSTTDDKENIDLEEKSQEKSKGSFHHLNGEAAADSLVARTSAAHQMLHGCSSENNSGNRWFDKTMQFIISEDGECGINYEHSPAEGIVVIELSEHLFRYM